MYGKLLARIIAIYGTSDQLLLALKVRLIYSGNNQKKRNQEDRSGKPKYLCF
ncbi:Uncharacterised protein [Sphingobacterium mizutaii]|uniref:Uncharacterized protein n=1 Tax=Sphingobacterium mizutaii TaxID=1010 RepID=A0AAJ4X8H5_9SPHI|nr:hypothetical protein SAMN05192578_105285 [Sphingobacterium mizutaii]SNV36300.1 Uncharacterised protein [Sphingobacterium mizutaii]